MVSCGLTTGGPGGIVMVWDSAVLEIGASKWDIGMGATIAGSEVSCSSNCSGMGLSMGVLGMGVPVVGSGMRVAILVSCSSSCILHIGSLDRGTLKIFCFLSNTCCWVALFREVTGWSNKVKVFFV